MNIRRKIKSPIRKLKPINWGDSRFDSSFLVLKWGENPYPPSSRIASAIEKSYKDVNRYPTLSQKLRKNLAAYASLTENQICLTNGIDKAFRLIAEVFIDEGNEAITFAPSYPVFDSAIEMFGGKVLKLRLQNNFTIPKFNKIRRYLNKNTKLIYICNPNNPTGNFIASFKEIEKLLKLGIVIIVDEAYFEFSNQTVVALLSRYENLIILRSFSKTFGLAGLRVGYTLSSPSITKYLRAVEESLEIFNIATPSLLGALAALENIQNVYQNIKKINATKTKLYQELEKLNIRVYPSQTSFVLMSIANTNLTASDFVNKMKKQKIILKDMSIYEGLSKYFVYMGIPAENQLIRVITAFKKVIGGK
ncbi:histidinol-phosphate aminotransferase family protein [Candidatus Microgenomates bacterium]|nr:MAG: histidinol-phosphate aminotransferase family protein [Candidatus Microgenomates bacterium]